MAPNTELNGSAKSKTAEVKRFNSCNDNGSPLKKRSNLSERNERCRKIIRNCFSHLHTNLNVLVIGGNNAGL